MTEQEWTDEELEQWKAMYRDKCSLEVFIKLVNALMFYADPDTYFAISVLPDPPCGGFADDFGEIEYFDDQDQLVETVLRPGEHARSALEDIFFDPSFDKLND